MKEVETRYLNCSVCAIFDGQKYAIGVGPSFEYPQIVVARQLAGEESGFMEDIFGEEKGLGGAIYTLSEHRLLRDQLEEMAVMMALTRIVKRELYNRKI